MEHPILPWERRCETRWLGGRNWARQPTNFLSLMHLAAQEHWFETNPQTLYIHHHRQTHFNWHTLHCHGKQTSWYPMNHVGCLMFNKDQHLLQPRWWLVIVRRQFLAFLASENTSAYDPRQFYNVRNGNWLGSSCSTSTSAGRTFLRGGAPPRSWPKAAISSCSVAFKSSLCEVVIIR